MEATLKQLRYLYDAVLSVPITYDSKYYKLYSELQKEIKRDLFLREATEGRPACFPDDFQYRPHEYCTDCTLWTIEDIITGDAIVAVMGGGYGPKGDGVDTFEFIDYRSGKTLEYASFKEIEDYLKQNPVML